MAGAFVSLVLDAVHNVDAGAKLTLVVMADAANLQDCGRTWQSLATIAARSCRTARQIRTDVRALELAQWIEALGTGLGGRGKATTYALRIDRMLLAVDAKKAAAHCKVLSKIPGIRLPRLDSVNPAVNAPKPGSEAPKTRQPTAPEPELKAFEPEISEPARAKPSAEVLARVRALATSKSVGKNLNPEPEQQRSRAEQLAYVAQHAKPNGHTDGAPKWAATEQGVIDHAKSVDRMAFVGESFIAWRARLIREEAESRRGKP